MAKGEAYGENLLYQKLCRDIVHKLQIQNNLVPYSKNGIDVTFKICGTDVTFDVVLKDSQDKVVVIECKRWKDSIKRKEIAAFAFDVECLRKDFKVEVAGIFITKTHYQIGAVKMANEIDVDVAICNQDQTPQNFIISFKRYDPQRDAVIQDIEAQLTANSQSGGDLPVTITRREGSVEYL